MADVIESHCPFCKKLTECEFEPTGCMSGVLKCTVCENTWREETDF